METWQTWEIWHILIALGVIAFIIEIFTIGFISGSVGIGLIFAGIFNYWGFETKWQILVFSFGVGLIYFLVKPIVMKYGYGAKSRIKMNQDALIDREGTVTQEINFFNDTGRVLIDGDDWRAKSKKNENISKGTVVRVVAIDSIVLFVKPLK